MYIVNSSSIVERRNTEKNINNETYMEKKTILLLSLL